MTRRVTVLGDATLDVRVVPAMPIRPGGDVPASVRLGPGGQGANISVRLARRGVAVRLVCRIGSDAAGEIVRSAIARDGVELAEMAAPFTGTVVVLVDERGERTMLSQRVPLLVPPTLPDLSAIRADWLVVSGYVLLEQGAGMSMTGDAPIRVLAGCALEPGMAEDWMNGARSVRPHLVVLNVDEARALCAEDLEPAELSRRLGTTLETLVIVTEPSGATAARGDVVVAAAAVAGEPPVDTTGAGDAFTAGLIAMLLEEPWPPAADRLTAAMRAAGALAGDVTRVHGAQARLPEEGGDQ